MKVGPSNDHNQGVRAEYRNAPAREEPFVSIEQIAVAMLYQK